MTHPEPPTNNTLTEIGIHAAIGTNGIAQLVRAFYRQIPTDDVLGPMYPPHDLSGAEERLRLFLTFRFGGPQDYLQHRGHPMLRARHVPFAINQQARDRWVRLMDQALAECQFSPDVSNVIRTFLANVATFLMNR